MAEMVVVPKTCWNCEWVDIINLNPTQRFCQLDFQGTVNIWGKMLCEGKHFKLTRELAAVEEIQPTLVCTCGHREGFKMNAQHEFICPECGANLGR